MTEIAHPWGLRSAALAAWTVPDAFIPPASTGAETSHESLCVLNMTDRVTELVLEAYFEDRAFMRSQPIAVSARTCLHLRTDDPSRVGGLSIPAGVPYGLVIRGDAAMRVQYSRLDTTQSAYALMSVIPTTEKTE